MRRFFHDNSLSIFLILFFVALLTGQAISGFYDYDDDRTEHGQPAIGFLAYLASPHFVEATSENFESEFLQLFIYVVATAYLVQRGSSESKDPDAREEVDDDPRAARDDPGAPWPVRRGGIALLLYANSLSLAFLLIFVASFLTHAYGGARLYDEEQAAHGLPADVSMFGYMATARFWFESFQNWQSEFLSLAAMVVLSIWLRQRGSPESKAVASPHSKTGK